MPIVAYAFLIDIIGFNLRPTGTGYEVVSWTGIVVLYVGAVLVVIQVLEKHRATRDSLEAATTGCRYFRFPRNIVADSI